MGGVDFRVARAFGIGPFVDVSVAQYSSGKITGDITKDGDITDKALHTWISLGAKVTFFP